MKTILTVNAGSSSVRLAAFSDDSGGPARLAASHYTNHEPAGSVELIRAFLRDNGGAGISVVSHRIVHGGDKLSASCLIDARVKREIEGLSPLAPLHNPVALRWVEACGAATGPEVPHVAVFDTAFYAGMPDAARIYALPRDLCRRHAVRRYGFHGIAHRAMWERLCAIRPDMAKEGRAVSLQLGAGCSITAVRGGRPVDTSMGFSPLEGLVMATRSGDVDPRVVTYLQQEAGYGPAELEDLLNRSSGLLGVSGLSADMRELLHSGNPDAALAVELYCYRARKYLGAYMAALGGADAVIFGGGVGENSPEVRRRILSGMKWCGIEVDDKANEAATGAEGRISPADSRSEAWVLPVDEAAVMAAEALKVLKERGQQKP